MKGGCELNKEEFINTCESCGYASRKIATAYAGWKKGELNENDYIEIFRQIERAKEISHDNGKFRDVEGMRTTKRFKQSERMGSDRD
jgi:hypothetical protein